MLNARRAPSPIGAEISALETAFAHYFICKNKIMNVICLLRGSSSLKIATCQYALLSKICGGNYQEEQHHNKINTDTTSNKCDRFTFHFTARSTWKLRRRLRNLPAVSFRHSADATGAEAHFRPNASPPSNPADDEVQINVFTGQKAMCSAANSIIISCLPSYKQAQG